MNEPKNMPTGYYRVRDGFFPSGAERWLVARWMPTIGCREGKDAEGGWRTGDGRFPAGNYQEIGAKVA
jgi:hypothetical protein